NQRHLYGWRRSRLERGRPACRKMRPARYNVRWRSAMNSSLLLVGCTMLALAYFGSTSSAAPSTQPSPLDFTVKDIDGKDVNLADYKGKVVLIVNVASKCGFTPQYKGLETLYRKYKDQGFVILGFPANNFKGQEPGTNEQIKEF